MAAVDSQMCCEFHCCMDKYVDKVKRVKLISMFTDLMVYDLEGTKDGIFVNDLEECLDEFMMDQYMTEPDLSDV